MQGKLATYEVVEIFESINGEGPNAGKLAVFIRLKGCNLTCSYCDTAWANTDHAPSDSLTLHTIIDRVMASGLSYVTLTGGEPLLADQVNDLIMALSALDLVIDIETNGSVDISPIIDPGYKNVNLIMDYKLPSSGMTDAMTVANMTHLRPQDTVKFVLGSYQDMEWAHQIIRTYGLRGKCHVYFSPVFGALEPVNIVDYMKKRQLNDVTLQLQLHKVIWHPDQKGV